ncbi:ricin-type beta-trefoil lectin domain protein, partial [Actinoplanes sp. NPDC051633]|uniref:ricin-type beta-trefoil lectin domain protein n=1 Tax=Actinoplanes sp. NPDC051633 TaxID=3155670 RepID=UPI00341EF8EB
VAAVVAVVGSASAATGSPVVGVASGRCLDVIGDSRAPKAGVNIYDCVPKPNQLWTYTSARELRVYDDTMCLDVAGAKTTAPAAVQIYPCNGGANQKWTLNADGSITGVQSGLCLDVEGAKTENSALVQMWTCNGQGNQKWRSSADTTPPTPPANPRVRDLVCDAVTFEWDASRDDVAVAFYDVYHDGQLMTSVSGQTLSAALTVVPGASWGLYVNARDAAGNVSQASATVPITPPPCRPDSEAPTTPHSLTATAAGTTVTLSWAASTDNEGVRAYDIYRDGAKAGTVAGTPTDPPATSFVDSGLAPARQYMYDVVARDAQANASPHSAPATVTTGAGCTNPVCSSSVVFSSSLV